MRTCDFWTITNDLHELKRFLFPLFKKTNQTSCCLQLVLLGWVKLVEISVWCAGNMWTTHLHQEPQIRMAHRKQNRNSLLNKYSQLYQFCSVSLETSCGCVYWQHQHKSKSFHWGCPIISAYRYYRSDICIKNVKSLHIRIGFSSEDKSSITSGFDQNVLIKCLWSRDVHRHTTDDIIKLNYLRESMSQTIVWDKMFKINTALFT